MIAELVLWTLFILSFSGMVFIVARKMPIVMALPEESLEFKETFINFLDRKKDELPSQLDNIKISFLESSDKRLMKLKTLSLKIHNKARIWTEFINKKFYHSKYSETDINEINIEDQIASFATCDENNAEDKETEV